MPGCLRDTRSEENTRARGVWACKEKARSFTHCASAPCKGRRHMFRTSPLLLGILHCGSAPGRHIRSPSAIMAPLQLRLIRGYMIVTQGCDALTPAWAMKNAKSLSHGDRFPAEVIAGVTTRTFHSHLRRRDAPAFVADVADQELRIFRPIHPIRPTHPLTAVSDNLAPDFRNRARHPLPSPGCPSPHAN
jgi:hypothetical protein